jgi:hypothetical protein
LKFFSVTIDVVTPVPEFIDPRFRENKPKTLIFSHRKRAFWACFRENWVYNFGHSGQPWIGGELLFKFWLKLTQAEPDIENL